MVKCYDNKMIKSPYNFVIFLLTQPQVANQQQQQKMFNGIKSFVLSCKTTSFKDKSLILTNNLTWLKIGFNFSLEDWKIISELLSM